MTEVGRAVSAKERGLAGLRPMQLRERRKDWRRVVIRDGHAHEML